MTAAKTWRLGDFAAIRIEVLGPDIEIVYGIRGFTPELAPKVSMFSRDEAELLGKQLQLLGRALTKASHAARENAKQAAIRDEALA